MRILGIDPGQHCGLAFIEAGKLVALDECPPEGLQDMLTAFAPDLSLVVFEDSRAAKQVWTSKGRREQRDHMARSVGEVDAWCKLIEALCNRLDIPAVGKPPSAKYGTKGKKSDAEAFARYTGWTRPSNQHKRDAALIAWPLREVKP